MEVNRPGLRVVSVVRLPVPEVVETLESLLAGARAGTVRSLAAVWETDRPYTTNSCTVWKDASVQMLIGELERIKFLLVTKLIGDDGDSIGLSTEPEEPEPVG